MSIFRKCKYCGHLITFNDIIKSINGKKKPLNLDSSIHQCYRIVNINKPIPNKNFNRGYQTLISHFCSSSLTDESLAPSNGKSDEKGLQYHQKELWKIGYNFFMAIDNSLIKKLNINENYPFIDQKVIETADNIMIQFRKSSI